VTPSPRPIPSPPPDLNDLRRGLVYRATTEEGEIVGEYLGIEVPYGDRAIILRSLTGTSSIRVSDLAAITPAA
jgi:hypothetical protein